MDTFDSGNIMGFTLTFPSGTILPGTISPQYVTANGQQSSGVLTNPTRREIIFTLPLGVPRSSEIVIKIGAEAGIKNPPAGQYIMDMIANKGLKTLSTKSFEIKTVSDPIIVTPDPVSPAVDKVVKLTINSVSATKNGVPITLDVPAALMDGFTMVPVRFVSDGLGATVDFNTIQNTVNLVFGTRTIVLWPGSSIAKVDNTPVTLAKAPVIVDGRTLVPIRFVSESFGAKVDFISNTQPITITVSGSNTVLPSVAAIQASQAVAAGSGSSGSTGAGTTGSGSTGTGTTGSGTNTLIGKTISLKAGNNNANLRSGPGTTYGKVGLLLPGETAKIIEVSGEWYRIKFDYNMEAWIRSDLIDVK
jgi:hypothetical protein